MVVYPTYGYSPQYGGRYLDKLKESISFPEVRRPIFR